jgi:nitrite reductase (NO-forming)
MTNIIQKHFYFLVTAVALTVVLALTLPSYVSSRVTADANPSGELVLQPKATLKTENALWSHAPMVPPPITRKEQRRVVVNWEVKETQAEIAPGVIYTDYWTFEGKVPGPVLRVREGDLVELHLKNGLTSKNPHNIDFHFVLGPGGGAHATDVMPGETAILEARAMVPGFYMLHCATPDIPTHVANGMYGYVIVEPAEGLPPVDHEFYVVQSEFYTANGQKGKQGLSLERGALRDPQYIVFNGAVNAMMGDRAVRTHVGESIRLWVGNAGPNLISSFHVIGAIFDKVYREGDLITPPARGVQTTIIPAGGSAVVEFTPAVPARYLLVDHAIFRLHKGAVAAIEVTGRENAEIFDAVSANKSKVASISEHGHSPLPPASSAPPVGEVVPAGQAASPAAKQAAKAAEPGKVHSGTATINILLGSGIKDDDPDNDYSPRVLTVKRGTKVTWVNQDDMVHNVAAEDGSFESRLLRQGDSWSFTFNDAGTFPYLCTPHPWMKGKVVVQ